MYKFTYILTNLGFCCINISILLFSLNDENFPTTLSHYLQSPQPLQSVFSTVVRESCWIYGKCPSAAVDLPSPSEQSQDLSEALGQMPPITPEAIFTQEPAPATLACLLLRRTSLLPAQPLHLLSPPTLVLIPQMSAGPFPCLL